MTKFSLMSIHRGEFLGVPSSGEVGTYSSIRIHRIAGSKIAEEWSEGNLLGVLLPSGHNFPCCRREHAGATSELSARGMPLGLMPGMSYEEKESVLASGEGVLF
jgi:hypothetical protein